MNNTGGRPTVITQVTIQKLEDAFRAGFTVSEACSVSGISRAAYYDHKASDNGFSDKMDRARAWVTLQAKYVVVQAITADHNVSHAKWWLERKSRNEFGTNPVDEDAQWQAQHSTEEADDTLRRILDIISDTAEGAIDTVATEVRTAPQTAQSPVIAPTLPTPEPAVATAPQAPEMPYDTSHDVMADLYDEC